MQDAEGYDAGGSALPRPAPGAAQRAGSWGWEWGYQLHPAPPARLARAARPAPRAPRAPHMPRRTPGLMGFRCLLFGRRVPHPTRKFLPESAIASTSPFDASNLRRMRYE